MDDLISVIVPFYNRLHLVEETILSIFNQSHRPIEIILIDDNSNEKINIESLEPPSGIIIKLIQNDKNIGPGKSREKGMHIASGDFIHFLDSDDLINPEFYTEGLSVLKKNLDSSFLYCFTKNFDKDNHIQDRRIPQIQTSVILPDILANGRIWSTSSCIWKKEITLHLNNWINGVWEDYHFDIRAGIYNNKICCLPKYFCYYRVDSLDKFSRVDSYEKNYSKLETINAINKELEKPDKNNIISSQILFIKQITQIINLINASKNFKEHLNTTTLLLKLKYHELGVICKIIAILPKKIKLIILRKIRNGLYKKYKV